MAGHRTRRALALLDLVVVIAIMGTLLGLSLVALQKVRGTSSRISCQNNMRQMGLAILQYQNQKGYFPPAQEGTGADVTTWLKLILPYVGYDNARPADPVPVYLCAADRGPEAMVYQGSITLKNFSATSCAPLSASATASDYSMAPVAPKPTSVNIVKYACTGYVAVVSSKNVNGPYDAVIYPMSRTRPIDIVDGQSNTILVGERPPSKDLVWGWWASPYKGDITMGTSNMYPFAVHANKTALKPFYCSAIPFFGPGSLDNPCDVQHFWSFHEGGGNWLFADGSVHFIPYSGALQIPKMATRSGGEVIDWLEVF